MKKKLIALTLCVLLVLSALLVLTACDKDGDYDYEITVWVGEGTKELTENQIAAFNETNEWGIKFKATVEIISESVSVGNAVQKPADCADLFCFAQDQLATAVRSNLLASLNGASVDFIKQNNDEASWQAATIGNDVRAFPMTSDNGYFMYYNKDVVAESHVGSLESIIADCQAAGQNLSWNLPGGWYAAAFFYATGCRSDWEINDKGAFVNYQDDFNSDNGKIALKGIEKVFAMGDRYVASDKVSTFSAGTPSAVVISGIWDFKAARTILGNKLGIAPLPSFTVDGTSYQLPTFLGHKFMGVKPQSDAYKALYLQKLAMYLTGETCQRQRFEEVGWGPSNLALQDDETVTSDALEALAATKQVLQGQYPINWWTEVETMMGQAKQNMDSIRATESDPNNWHLADTTIANLLESYQGNLGKLISAE